MITASFIPIIAASLVIVSYAIYLLYSSRNEKLNKELDFQKRLNKTVNDTGAVQKNASVSLLKSTPDTYFKTKLPKVEGIKEWIQHAGLDIKPFIFVTISLVVGIIAGLCFLIVFHINVIISFLLGVISSFFLPWILIAFLTSRRKKKFLEEFPIALDIIRRALKAGHSIDRSIGMVVEQLSGPVGLSFKQMVDKLNLGRTFDDVLAEMANSIGIDDFRMLAIVIVLQRETGGSLAEAIDNFSKIIRSRQILRKKVKALTAEVRVTAMILTAIPFFIFGVVYYSTPNYFDPLFNTDNGHILLFIGIAMLVIGIGTIIRMTYRENY